MNNEDFIQLLHDSREDFLEYADCDEEVLDAFIERVIHSLEMV